MPKFIVTINETTFHRFVAEAPSATYLEGAEAADEMADLCAANTHLVAVTERVIRAEPCGPNAKDRVDEDFTPHNGEEV